MSNMQRQTSFTGGEVDAVNWKRTDLEAYLTCAQSLRNMEISTVGLANKRKGSTWSLTVTDQSDPNSQIFNFRDNNGNYYLLMADNLAFHIYLLNAGALTLFQTVTTPYLSAELQDIDWTIENDVLVLAHANHPTARIFVQSYGPAFFVYAQLNIYPAPAFDFSNIAYNAFTVAASVSTGTLTFQFTGLSSNPGYTTAWIGGQIIGGGATDIDPIGYAIITNVVPWDGTKVVFTAAVQIPFGTTFATVGSQYSVKQPLFTAALGYPSRCLFYQNRLWLAGTHSQPNTIMGSKINTPVNYDVGTGRDTDAIIYTLQQNEAGAIIGMNGGKQLEIYTEFFEFVCPQEQNSALTPSTFSVRQQSANGSSINCKAVSYDNDSYYVAQTGNAIIQFQFQGVGLAYKSINVSLASSHLVKNPVNRALLRGTATSQDNFIYYLNSDNTLTAFQFNWQFQLAALTPVEFEQGVEVLDICSLNNQIYFLKRYNGTVYALEYFDPTVRTDGAITATLQSNGEVTGLTHLIDYKVDVLYDTESNLSDLGEYVVDETGTIQVNNPQALTGPVSVGIIYDVDITPMFIYSGANEADYYKSVSRVFTDYYNSLNFSVNGYLVPYQTFAEIQSGAPLAPKSGTAKTAMVNGWQTDSTFSITQHAPFDLQIVAISYQVASAIQ